MITLSISGDATGDLMTEDFAYNPFVHELQRFSKN